MREYPFGWGEAGVEEEQGDVGPVGTTGVGDPSPLLI